MIDITLGIIYAYIQRQESVSKNFTSRVWIIQKASSAIREMNGHLCGTMTVRSRLSTRMWLFMADYVKIITGTR